VPGRTPADAVKAFLEPIQLALSCIAHGKITVTPGGYGSTEREHVWAVNRVNGAVLPGCGLRLRGSMRYQIVPTAEGEDLPFRCTTRGYIYAIEHVGSGQEIAAWHWHPNSAYTAPHLHVGSSQLESDATLTGRAHLGSGRTSFEAVVRSAVELGAKPIREDWEHQLDLTRGVFEIYRSWGTTPPEVTGRHRKDA
jgi:hypothetical protein